MNLYIYFERKRFSFKRQKRSPKKKSEQKRDIQKKARTNTCASKLFNHNDLCINSLTSRINVIFFIEASPFTAKPNIWMHKYINIHANCVSFCVNYLCIAPSSLLMILAYAILA